MNDVKIIRQFPEEEVEQIMRDVRLSNYPDVRPYRNAKITFSDADTLQPSAFYVLLSRIDFFNELNAKLLEAGVDILNVPRRS